MDEYPPNSEAPMTPSGKMDGKAGTPDDDSISERLSAKPSLSLPSVLVIVIVIRTMRAPAGIWPVDIFCSRPLWLLRSAAETGPSVTVERIVASHFLKSAVRTVLSPWLAKPPSHAIN